MSTRTVEHKGTLLQRLLTNAQKGFTADHIDGDTTNNRKENLSVCTFQENCRNRKTSHRNSSGYRGVCWSKKDNKWMAYIHLDLGKTFKNLGYFIDKDKAYQARLDAEDTYYKEFLVVTRDTDANKINYPKQVS